MGLQQHLPGPLQHLHLRRHAKGPAVHSAGDHRPGDRQLCPVTRVRDLRRRRPGPDDHSSGRGLSGWCERCEQHRLLRHDQRQRWGSIPLTGRGHRVVHRRSIQRRVDGGRGVADLPHPGRRRDVCSVHAVRLPERRLYVPLRARRPEHYRHPHDGGDAGMAELGDVVLRGRNDRQRLAHHRVRRRFFGLQHCAILAGTGWRRADRATRGQSVVDRSVPHRVGAEPNQSVRPVRPRRAGVHEVVLQHERHVGRGDADRGSGFGQHGHRLHRSARGVGRGARLLQHAGIPGRIVKFDVRVLDDGVGREQQRAGTLQHVRVRHAEEPALHSAGDHRSGDRQLRAAA